MYECPESGDIYHESRHRSFAINAQHIIVVVNTTVKKKKMQLANKRDR